MHPARLMGVIAFGLLASCDSGGPSTGEFTFSGTLDRQPWVADTMVAIAFASPTDTSIVISAARKASLTEEQQITVISQAFGQVGQIALTDTAPGIGVFGSLPVSGDTAAGNPVIWQTRSGTPGVLAITSVSRQDSLVSGTFAFEASTSPDTTAHRHVTATFRVRYSIQPVFVP